MTLIEKNGTLVLENTVRVGHFLRRIGSQKGNSRWSGSLEELEELAQEFLHDWTPGIGSVEGDVRLIRVPPEGFYSTIVEVTPENEHLVVEVAKARVEGEAPVIKKFIDVEPSPAKVVNLVLYRADVIERNSKRYSHAEWEIVAIHSQPRENVPMHPTTMLRNYCKEVGGTYREYSEDEWDESEEFWSLHAFAGVPE